jgi:hypothetical protein
MSAAQVSSCVPHLTGARNSTPVNSMPPLQAVKVTFLATTIAHDGKNTTYIISPFAAGQTNNGIIHIHTISIFEMASYCFPPSLPNDKSDLNTLVDWFYAHDADWMADALWLRYLKIVKRVYHADDSAIGWELREAQFEELRFARKQARRNKKVPLPCAILPEIQEPEKKVDRLSALPHDIRFEILSYLLRANIHEDIYGKLTIAAHPLNNLALVSRAWRDQVDAFCSHSLLVWKQAAENYTEDMDSKSNWVEWRKLAIYTSNPRMEYTFRVRTYCWLCAEETSWWTERWPGLRCCEICRAVEHEEFGSTDDDESE